MTDIASERRGTEPDRRHPSAVERHRVATATIALTLALAELVVLCNQGRPSCRRMIRRAA